MIRTLFHFVLGQHIVGEWHRRKRLTDGRCCRVNDSGSDAILEKRLLLVIEQNHQDEWHI